MEIQELKVFDAPNIFSLRETIVKLQVKLGELADIPTRDIAGLNEKILQYFPGVRDHKCATGYVGGFVDRLREGTYLSHVTEHLSLEVQRMLGYDKKYGKARQVKDDVYNIIFACTHPITGKACATFVINTLNAWIEGREVDFDNELKMLKKIAVKYDIGVSTGAIVSEARKRGIPVSLVNDGELVRLGYGKYQRCISATLFEGTSSIAVDIACNKQLTRVLLEEAALPVPQGRSVMNLEEALGEADAIGYPVVVKPKNGNKGKLVFLNVTDTAQLEAAFRQAVTFDGEVVVEKYIKGRDYRILVVNGQVVAAAERVPAQVVGDGLHTVEELIAIENKSELRGDDHERPLTRIRIDDNVTAVLQKQGISLSHVPEVNRKILLRENANLSTGGLAYDCTDAIHPENRRMFEAAAKAIGLDIAGIDVVTPDISKPLEADSGAIVEVNAAPGIRMHMCPARGEPRDVAAPILDMIFPAGVPSSIPIISITGTNGKTTTTRMISSILRQQGLTVGTTTTHGIYVNDTCIEDGDTTGPFSARRILHNRSVEAAVLETARGGILRDGLAYGKADVAVFMNLTEDHLGIDGIQTMEELLNVKSLVTEAVKEAGACVLNADDPWVMKARAKAKGKHVLFSLDHKNPLLLEHIQNGGTAIYSDQFGIHVINKGIVWNYIPLEDIPATLGGKLKHNVYNSMAAIGAGYALEVPFDVIEEALGAFSCDVRVNPGRFNIFELDGFRVVLDYGHNMDGYRVTIDGLEALKPSRLVGIIGVPGDRLDSDVLNVGRLAGSAFDYLYVKEDRDLRGRQPLEVANLLCLGALSGGAAHGHMEIVPDEAEALRKAIRHARKGDVIAVFFEKMQPLLDIIQEYRPVESTQAKLLELVTM